ncbi:hypothetical protein QBE52_04970 [Clostridiaceae bacterium 35-E11]
MKRLMGEIIEQAKPVKVSTMTYATHKEFFIALVSICEDLAIDVPFWTSREDRLLEKNQVVLLPLNNHIILRISSEDLSTTLI